MYFETGPTVLLVGTWLFEKGGMIGYALRDSKELFAKLMFEVTPNANSYLTEEGYSELMESLPTTELSFTNWYAVPFLASIGLDYPATPPPKDWTKKIPPELANGMMSDAFLSGALAGNLAPDSFRDIWEAHYNPNPQDWRESFEAGIIDSSEQETLVFEDELRLLLLHVDEWIESEFWSSGLTGEDASEFRLLVESIGVDTGPGSDSTISDGETVSTVAKEELPSQIQGSEDTKNELNEVLEEAYSKVFVTAALCASAFMKICETKWRAKLQPVIGARVHVEFYYFYAYLLDRLSFEVLGEKGRAFFMGAVVDLGLTPLVKHSFPDAGEEAWGRMIGEQSNNYDSAVEEYSACRVFMLERADGPMEDAFSDDPVAQVSRLFQNILLDLKQNTPQVDAKDLDVFFEIHSIVLGQVQNMDIREDLKKISALVA